MWCFGTYFGETCGEDAHFKVFGHLFQEVLGAGTFHDIDIRDTAFDIDWDCIVRASDLVELTVDQGLIQVKYQRLHPVEALRLGPEESVWPLAPPKDHFLLPARHASYTIPTTVVAGLRIQNTQPSIIVHMNFRFLIRILATKWKPHLKQVPLRWLKPSEHSSQKLQKGLK